MKIITVTLAILLASGINILMLKAAVDSIEDQQQVIITELQRQNLAIKSKSIISPIDVIVTAYSSRPEETDSTPFETAFLTMVKPGIIAVSRDLFLAGWTPGKKVYIYQLGVYTIEDLMHERKTEQIDIYEPDTKKALTYTPRIYKAILLDL